ncbi:oplophorus-luciferin 2-monooxygenase non-catalytic subunit-like [Palaemon carinicauda]|uniref:oplophorus-luciferin 2-monooxygenase non-catalytic subunit-like n=1 Tax=Palaemon carinicauda TaxID=392227 RepID=UPI0035B6A9E0
MAFSKRSRPTFCMVCLFYVQLLGHFCTVAGTGLPLSVPSQRTLQQFSEVSIKAPGDIPCPYPGDIEPCICTVNDDYSMDMDCSKIRSEEDLQHAFSKKFPFYKFRKLIIENNDNFRVLGEGALGNASFEEININNCALNEIELHALHHSRGTLESLRLNDNKLWSFPSFDLTQFPKLSYFSAQRNSFTVFPELVSYSLKTLFLDGNNFEHLLSESTTKGLPSLEIISLQNCSLTELSPESFSSNIHLSAVNLGFNSLTHLQYGTVNLSGPNSQLSLHSNKITHLPKGSFSGVKMIMDVRDNFLEELEEAVWRPLLEDNVSLTLEGNPFVCGCDIAWLIVNQNLLDKVADRPTCHDGEAFIDLDPHIYEALC